ncbi:MAG: TIGR00730 family Rossman fold protein [Gemmataceae bacterium]|nr:TIGR00730 family Rossman fold protein [Gemmataceae bacterium]MCS7271851.1 TIGR00730 family Rossman fold protein [Gemmataceae bacterium]MDW8242573.1 TIGR00730 family Rossman fold protein [Thermogemmata sp.]
MAQEYQPLPRTPFHTSLDSEGADSAPARSSTAPPAVEDYVQQIKETADKLLTDQATRGDVRLLATAIRELRYCFKIFAAYRHRRKVSIFGSARTPPHHPAYKAAEEFGRQIAAAGWMVITGAGSGIMEAGHRGAGRESSFGLNILLPFEQAANPVVQGDPKLVTMRYFFTRKLMFIKESDAVVLFPGGFGTHDECFEALTLIQTGKSHLFPIVMVDEPGGNYWQLWQHFIHEGLVLRGYISPHDTSLYYITDSVEEAVRHVIRFYRIYHSLRYVRGDLVLRLQKPLTESLLQRIRHEFSDILSGGDFELIPRALPEESNEPELAHLPRLKFRFQRQAVGRLRQLIDLINLEG